MKAGRPAYHIRAKWITLMGPQGSLVYYELDSKGNLKNKKQDIPPNPQINTNQNTKQTIPLAETDGKGESPCLDLQKTEPTKEEIKDDNITFDLETDATQDFFSLNDDITNYMDNNDVFNNDSFSWDIE